MTELGPPFLALVAGQPRAAALLAAWPALESTLRRHVDTTRARWPAIAVAPVGLLRALADRLPVKPGSDPCRWLDAVHAADVYLAHACASGDAAALAAFDRACLPEIAAYIARTGSSAELADEVRQVIRERLLVASPNARPRIATYSGRGPLGAWLRMIAVRTALNLRRGRKEHAGDHELERTPSSPDPELDYMKARYRPVFRAALEASLSELPAEQRNTLRLYFIDGLTLAEIGALYRVHESTIARQMAKIRRDVLATTRRLLVERHRLGADEVDSLLGLGTSQLELSLSRILKQTNG